MRARASALLLVLLLAGCVVGGDDSGFERASLPRLVLAQGDLSNVWAPFSSGRQIRADSPGGNRADPQRFGRIDGWIARFHRPGSQATRGPLVIESRADLFGSAGGAGDELETARHEIGFSPGRRAGFMKLADPKLGDEAFAATLVEQSADEAISDVRYYLISWRHDNVVASIFANGFDGRFTFAQALELARAQERRMNRAGPQPS